MNKKHEKSACCRADVIKYGKKRRQCVLCKRTWRVWKKKRGRKTKRSDGRLIVSFLKREISSLAFLSRKLNVSETTAQKKLRRSMEYLNENLEWAKVPDGDLIMVADAVIECVEKEWHTIYLMMVRSVSLNIATILPPLIRRGTETAEGWRNAMATVSDSVLSRVKALVSDGHRGLMSEALWRNWIVQRCHFHLLARIQGRRSRFPSARNKKEAEKIFKYVRIVLGKNSKEQIEKSLSILEEIGWHSTSPEIRKVLSGFVRYFEDYRSYLTYPEFRLPTTNNSAESLGSLIADLKQRLRGFHTVSSFSKWITILLKFRQTIQCNKHQPN